MVIHLTGPDTYRSHQRFNQLREAFRAKHDRQGFSTLIVDATTAKLEDVRTALATAGFLSAKRFVGINHYDLKANATLDPTQLAALLTPLTKADEVIIVVRELTATPAKRPTKKAAAKKKAELRITGAKVEEFPAMSDSALVTWVARQAKAAGAAIDRSAAERLVMACEQDTWRIASELAKLADYVGRRPITVKDVEAMVVTPYASDIFALTDALGNRQPGRALQLLHRELAAGTHPLVLITMFGRHLHNLITVKAALTAGLPPRTLPQRLNLHPFVVQKATAQARQFSLEHLKVIHHRLVMIDYDLKTSPLEAEALLDLLLMAV